MTTLLILTVWLLGAMQLILSFITEKQGFIAYDLAVEISHLAANLWVSKWIACFAIFYMILAVALHGRLKGHRAKVAGAAAGALAWVIATWGFHLYLKFTALDNFYGALASVILGFIWLATSVSSLLFGAALTAEWAARQKEPELVDDEDDVETPAA
jgi:membrane protein